MLGVSGKVLCLFLLVVTTLVGDCLLEGDFLKMRLRGSFGVSEHGVMIMRALLDNGTHCLIGFLAWLAIDSGGLSRSGLQSALLCGLIASLVDVDHFVQARSLSLKVNCFLSFMLVCDFISFFYFWFQEAIGLSRRPFMHCTTMVLAVFLLLNRLSGLKGFKWKEKLSWIFLVATVTHHWRDGYRRGLWFCPFGSTPPYPYHFYLLGLVTMPPLINILKDSVSKSDAIKEVELV